MNLSIDFAPPIAAAWIWLIAGLAAVSVFYALWHRRHILGLQPAGDVFETLAATSGTFSASA